MMKDWIPVLDSSILDTASLAPSTHFIFWEKEEIRDG
jgi:hypothetical protein